MAREAATSPIALARGQRLRAQAAARGSEKAKSCEKCSWWVSGEGSNAGKRPVHSTAGSRSPKEPKEPFGDGSPPAPASFWLHFIPIRPARRRGQLGGERCRSLLESAAPPGPLVPPGHPHQQVLLHPPAYFSASFFPSGRGCSGERQSHEGMSYCPPGQSPNPAARQPGGMRVPAWGPE